MVNDNFVIHKVNLKDAALIKKVNQLLVSLNLQPDIIDNCAVIFDEDNNVIATISSYLNTIKCLAVKEEYQGNNLVNKLVTYMIQEIYHRHWNEIFIFAKQEYLAIFRQLGFQNLYQNNIFAFLTNRYDLFVKYLDYLKQQRVKKAKTSVIVMNANPFTKGHQYLVEQASKASDFVYIIPVREETSLFSYQQRLAMIKLGTKKFNNVKVLEGSYYLVSKNVFPSYFLTAKQELITQQTELDAHIFVEYIARALDAKIRFVGDEPLSPTTNDYNDMMAQVLPKNNIKLIIIPRLKINNQVVSATLVRKYFVANDFLALKNFVPETTFDYLQDIKKNK